MEMPGKVEYGFKKARERNRWDTNRNVSIDPGNSSVNDTSNYIEYDGTVDKY